MNPASLRSLIRATPSVSTSGGGGGSFVRSGVIDNCNKPDPELAASSTRPCTRGRSLALCPKEVGFEVVWVSSETIEVCRQS